MLHEAIALFVGLFVVAQLWIAILESRLGPFPSRAFRAAVLVVSLSVPLVYTAVRARRATSRTRLPSVWSLVVLAAALITSLLLFASIEPYHPDHDDTFRAGFVRAILGTGYPPASSWWTAAAPGTVVYYLLTENLVAQVGAFSSSLSTLSLYEHGLKLAYIACDVLLGFSIARSLGALDNIVVRGRTVATIAQALVAMAAFLLLIFGATPFDLAVLHILGVSQSGVAHTVLLLFLALVARRPSTDGSERVAIDLCLWSLPAFLAAAKFPFAPALVVALALHWLLSGQWRVRSWRAVVMPAYFVLSMTLAVSATRLGGAADKHPIRWMPLQLFHELAPQWFHFASWPLAYRVAVAFGLLVAPLLLLLWLSARRAGWRQDLRSPTGQTLVLCAAVMFSGYFASATVAFADRTGANELYWFVQGWSALNALTFIAVLAAPPSWLKLAAIPLAAYAVGANLSTLKRTSREINAPLSAAALDACDVVAAWSGSTTGRRNSVVAHPFDSWDFAACTSLPTLAPPDDRYDAFARVNPILLPSRRYMQQLVAAPTLPSPPLELQPTLTHFAHVLVIRPRARPLADARATLVGHTRDFLFYDWPTR